jgi:hypothetical protein
MGWHNLRESNEEGVGKAENGTKSTGEGTAADQPMEDIKKVARHLCVLSNIYFCRVPDR